MVTLLVLISQIQVPDRFMNLCLLHFFRSQKKTKKILMSQLKKEILKNLISNKDGDGRKRSQFYDTCSSMRITG